MPTVRSADGTTIAYEATGSGPAVVLVDGAMCYRASHGQRPLAALLAERFTVHVYDRRGRGESSDTAPFAVEREVEDLAAVIDAAGGSASVFGTSSGAVLTLRAAAAGLPIDRIAIYEPPFALDGTLLAEQRTALDAIEVALASGHRSRAVTTFMRLVGVPAVARAVMRVLPMWRDATGIAHTLPYDLTTIGAAGPVPLLTDRPFAAVTTPALVLAGGKSPAATLVDPARAVAAQLPDARFAILDGQTHMVAPTALAPALADFFAVGDRAPQDLDATGRD